MTKPALALVLFLALVPAAAAACGGGGDDSDGPTAPAGDNIVRPGVIPRISVVDNAFSPTGTFIKVGETVVWSFDGSSEHSVKGEWDGRLVESPVQSTGKFEFKFEKAGSFAFECGVHGAGMKGKVVVSE